ncbi:MAG: hypothetical protein HQK60_14995 [Deltaproteobacteria bacterium]|nr:hypothetical protein [Deltaproteobacteria bacterium]
MALDEPTATDSVFDIKGITYLVEPTLMDQAKKIEVDFVEYGMQAGLKISSEVSLGGGSCGSTSCSC